MIGSFVSSLSISVVFGAMLAGGPAAHAATVSRPATSAVTVAHAASPGVAGPGRGSAISG